MIGQPLDFVPMWALYLLTVLAMLATMEGGYRLTRARQRKAPEKADASVGAMVGASLALLAFLAAFKVRVPQQPLFELQRQLNDVNR